MDAQEFVNQLQSSGRILRVCAWLDDGDSPIGCGNALVVDEANQIAIMLEDCGQVPRTKVAMGAFVKFYKHPEARESKVVGTAAYATPREIR